MFINAKSALTDLATQRMLPSPATVEHSWHGEWVHDATGTSVEYLASMWNDAKALWGNARIVDDASGRVIFSG